MRKQEQALREVVDARNTRHRLHRLLGQGGQGAVYEIAGGRLAAKVLFDTSPVRREQLRRQLTHVKLLPLADLPVARPMEMLQPPVLGYVMELVTGMMPLERLLSPPEPKGITAWYLETGGLRRRLQLLARLAELLSRLHGLGLVYTDPSPRNTFVSETSEQLELWLIDADNLHYESRPGTSILYTPGYGAPELVRSTGAVNTLTDVHALAVMVFQTLSLIHPLVGDVVDDGEPELQDRAFAGDEAFPWVEHPTDARNRSSRGIPRELVLSRQLRELCEKAFGDGLRTPLARPSPAAWAEALHEAADLTLACPECSGTFYVKHEQCPFCARPREPFTLLHMQRWEPSRPERPVVWEARPVWRVALESKAKLELPARVTEGHTGTLGRRPRVELSRSGRNVGVRCLEGECFASTPDGGQPVRIERTRRTLPPEWLLHFGPLEQPHRVARFEPVEAKR